MNFADPKERTRSEVINYVGWTGHGNVGDEALLAANQKAFSQYKLISSFNSLERTRPKLLSGVTLFGGGTLFPRWPASTMPNKYNYAYGVGAVDPDFFCFQYGTQAKSFYEYAILKTKKFGFRLIGVRGEASRKLLHSWGIKSVVVGDPSLLLHPSSFQNKEDNLVAVNVGSSEIYEPVWGKTEQTTKEIIKLCMSLKKDGYVVVLIPFCDDDATHVREISEKTGLPIFQGYHNLQSLLDFVSSCNVLIGQRLHSVALSAAALTPFLSISYHPKCQEFSESVGFQEFNIKVDCANNQNLMRTFHSLMKNWDQMYDVLQEKVDMYRRKLSEFASRIVADIESLPETKWISPGLWKQSKFYIINELELRAPRISRIWARL